MSDRVLLSESDTPEIANGGLGWLMVLFGAAITVVAFANGGYFSDVWGWLLIVAVWAAGASLVFGRARKLPSQELIFTVGLAAFVAWVALSTTWSSAVPQTAMEIERDLVYPAAAFAALLLVRRRQIAHFAGGLAFGGAFVALYALVTRLDPGRFGSYEPLAVYRLAKPLGYWNALGIFAVLTALVMLGFAVQARTPAVRAIASGALCVLAPTIYFTYGRGPLIAIALGLIVMFVVDPSRLRLVTALLFAAPAPLLAVWLASRSAALTTQQSSLGDASRDGHHLAAAIIVLALFGATLSAALSFATRRMSPPRAVRRGYACALIAAAALGVGFVFVHYGSPATIADRAYSSFKAPPIGTHAGHSLNERLLNLSSNGRVNLWRVAWEDFKSHKLLGSGAGTYAQYWARARPVASNAQDAHSLYLEVLGELGPVGLTLLAIALSAPLLAVRQARRHPLGPSLVAAYCAFLVHAGVDWDWEMPAVTVLGLFCGAGILICARHRARPPLPRLSRRALVVATVPVTAIAVAMVIGNSALQASNRSLATRDFPRAASAAHRAIQWSPWSAEAWQALGWAQQGMGRRVAAQRSFRRAIAKSPDNYDLWLSLAFATEGQTQGAALSQVKRLNPRFNLKSEFQRAR